MANVAFQPGRDQGVPADLTPPVQFDSEKLEIPLKVDVLRGKAAGGRPLVGETTLATATLTRQGAVIAGPALNGGAPVEPAPPCLPRPPKAVP
jgi:hypothetical protein